MRKIIIVFCLLAFVFPLAFSQSNPKLGYINSMALISSMPEFVRIRKILKAEETKINKQLNNLKISYEAKLNDFKKISSGNTTAREVKAREVQLAMQEIQTFSRDAQISIKKKEADLLKPLQKKINDALQKVAKRKGYSYIFDSSTGKLIYTSPGSDNLLPVLKKELGIR